MSSSIAGSPLSASSGTALAASASPPKKHKLSHHVGGSSGHISNSQSNHSNHHSPSSNHNHHTHHHQEAKKIKLEHGTPSSGPGSGSSRLASTDVASHPTLPNSRSFNHTSSRSNSPILGGKSSPVKSKHARESPHGRAFTTSADGYSPGKRKHAHAHPGAEEHSQAVSHGVTGHPGSDASTQSDSIRKPSIHGGRKSPLKVNKMSGPSEMPIARVAPMARTPSVPDAAAANPPPTSVSAHSRSSIIEPSLRRAQQIFEEVESLKTPEPTCSLTGGGCDELNNNGNPFDFDLNLPQPQPQPAAAAVSAAPSRLQSSALQNGAVPFSAAHATVASNPNHTNTASNVPKANASPSVSLPPTHKAVAASASARGQSPLTRTHSPALPSVKLKEENFDNVSDAVSYEPPSCQDAKRLDPTPSKEWHSSSHGITPKTEANAASSENADQSKSVPLSVKVENEDGENENEEDDEEDDDSSSSEDDDDDEDEDEEEDDESHVDNEEGKSAAAAVGTGAGSGTNTTSSNDQSKASKVHQDDVKKEGCTNFSLSAFGVTNVPSNSPIKTPGKSANTPNRPTSPSPSGQGAGTIRVVATRPAHKLAMGAKTQENSTKILSVHKFNKYKSKPESTKPSDAARVPPLISPTKIKTKSKSTEAVQPQKKTSKSKDKLSNPELKRSHSSEKPSSKSSKNSFKKESPKMPEESKHHLITWKSSGSKNKLPELNFSLNLSLMSPKSSTKAEKSKLKKRSKSSEMASSGNTSNVKSEKQGFPDDSDKSHASSAKSKADHKAKKSKSNKSGKNRRESSQIAHKDESSLLDENSRSGGLEEKEKSLGGVVLPQAHESLSDVAAASDPLASDVNDKNSLLYPSSLNGSELSSLGLGDESNGVGVGGGGPGTTPQLFSHISDTPTSSLPPPSPANTENIKGQLSFLSEQAKIYKKKADGSATKGLESCLDYAQAVIFYIAWGNACLHSGDPEKAYKLFTSKEIQIIINVAMKLNRKNYHNPQNPNIEIEKDRIDIISVLLMRIRAYAEMQAYNVRKEQAARYSRTLLKFIEERKANASQSGGGGMSLKGGDPDSPAQSVVSNGSSGGSISSVPSSGLGGERERERERTGVSGGGGGGGQMAMLNDSENAMFEKFIEVSQYIINAHDNWEQASLLLKRPNVNKFYHTVDSSCGYAISLQTSPDPFINHCHAVINLIRPKIMLSGGGGGVVSSSTTTPSHALPF